MDLQAILRSHSERFSMRLVAFTNCHARAAGQSPIIPKLEGVCMDSGGRKEPTGSDHGALTGPRSDLNGTPSVAIVQGADR
jgi:hypothetical protein